MTPELLRLMLASVCLHAAMTGTRLAAPSHGGFDLDLLVSRDKNDLLMNSGDPD